MRRKPQQGIGQQTFPKLYTGNILNVVFEWSIMSQGIASRLYIGTYLSESALIYILDNSVQLLKGIDSLSKSKGILIQA